MIATGTGETTQEHRAWPINIADGSRSVHHEQLLFDSVFHVYNIFQRPICTCIENGCIGKQLATLPSQSLRTFMTAESSVTSDDG